VFGLILPGTYYDGTFPHDASDDGEQEDQNQAADEEQKMQDEEREEEDDEEEEEEEEHSDDSSGAQRQQQQGGRMRTKTSDDSVISSKPLQRPAYDIPLFRLIISWPVTTWGPAMEMVRVVRPSVCQFEIVAIKLEYVFRICH